MCFVNIGLSKYKWFYDGLICEVEGVKNSFLGFIFGVVCFSYVFCFIRMRNRCFCIFEYLGEDDYFRVFYFKWGL